MAGTLVPVFYLDELFPVSQSIDFCGKRLDCRFPVEFVEAKFLPVINMGKARGHM